MDMKVEWRENPKTNQVHAFTPQTPLCGARVLYTQTVPPTAAGSTCPCCDSIAKKDGAK